MNKLKHVAVILDGNGRWALERGKKRTEGHKEGAKTLEKLVLHVARNTDIEVLSLYAFSTENFKRDKKEVNTIMSLFVKWFEMNKDKYTKENIKIVFSGRKEPLSDKVYSTMKEFEKKTENGTGLLVNFCINYGGRAEIVDASLKLADNIKNNKISKEDVTESYFSKLMYHDLPDVDLMIRTSGEQRLSNFMLWQNSYAEFVFVDKYFPDFDEVEFNKAVDEYYKRNRRFGKIN